MPITSQNFTVDNLDTSLHFVFRYRDDDISTGAIVIGAIYFGAGLIYLFSFMPNRLFQILQDQGILWFIFAISFNLLFFGLGVTTFIEMFWKLNGKEIVKINVDGISIRHQVFNFGITKDFSAGIISCAFISRHKYDSFFDASRESRFSSFKRGKIALNINGGKTFNGEVITFRFGSILDPDETKQVIAIIHNRFPQYKCPAKSAG